MFCFSSCQREDSDTEELIDNLVPEPETYHDGNVFVVVRDAQNFALSGTLITIHDEEILTYINGVGILTDVPCGAHGTIIEITKNGFAPSYSYVHIPKGDISNIKIKLSQLRSDVQFDSQQPYTLEVSEGVNLNIKANTFKYSDGATYTGQIYGHHQMLNASLNGVPMLSASGTKRVFSEADIMELYFHDQQGRRLYTDEDIEIEKPSDYIVAGLNAKANSWISSDKQGNLLPGHLLDKPFAVGKTRQATYVTGHLVNSDLSKLQLSSALKTLSTEVPVSQNGYFGLHFPTGENIALWQKEACESEIPLYDGNSGFSSTNNLGAISLKQGSYSKVTSEIMTCFEPLSTEDFIYTIITTPLDTMLFYQTENANEVALHSCHTDIVAKVYQGGQFAYSIETSLVHQNTLRSSNICLSSAKNFLQINGSRQQYDTSEFFILLEHDAELTITDLNNFVITFDKVEVPTRVQAHTILFNAPFDIA